MNRIVLRAALSALIGLGVLLAGCAAIPAKPAAAPGSGYQVTDDSGYTLTLPAKPRRIVSLSYSSDEILAELVELKRIAAFSRWADDPGITFITPEQAAAVAGRAQPVAEALLALQPDLVVATTGTRPEEIATLREIRIPVFVSHSPRSVEQVKRRVLSLARAVGEEDNGRRLVARMEQRLQVLAATLSPLDPDKRKCVMAFDFVGVIGSRNNLLADLFRYANLRNGAGEAGFDNGETRLSKEQIVAVNPDLFLLPTWNYDGRNSVEAYRQQFLDDPALQTVAAVRNNRVFLISDRYRYVGSQHAVDSIEQFARAAYPELFAKSAKESL
ncbi:MAG: ABC transporter substrate-binding protein [Sporomusaceae bacterium]|nr:ABC transporter substrate-binding protein [Sporomusaceae bacterium]